MIYKFPIHAKSKEYADLVSKVNALPNKAVWDDIYRNNYLVSIKQYEWILSEINGGRISTDINSQKLSYEAAIAKTENELLRMLNEPTDLTDLDKALEKVKGLSGQGAVSIRPPSGGKYSLPKIREPKTKP